MSLAASLRTFALVGLLSHLVLSGIASAQPASAPQASIGGRITDGSGGALPGVTVTIVSPNLATPVAVITDGGGQYTSGPLAPDTYAVAFELSGFETRTNSNI